SARLRRLAAVPGGRLAVRRRSGSRPVARAAALGAEQRREPGPEVQAVRPERIGRSAAVGRIPPAPALVEERDMRIEGDTRTRLLAVAMTAPAAIPASAQVGDRFLQVQRENALALRKYQWKSRVEVRREGETSGVQIFLMRHGVDGSVQKTPIGGTPPPDRPRGPLKKKIAEKKVKAYQELVKELSGLAQAYASLPPDRMQA